MNGNDQARVIFMLIVLVFVAAGLISRRISFGNLSKMIATWIFIFGGLIVIFSFRDQLKSVWMQVKTELGVSGNRIDANGRLVIPMGSDGHFWADVTINGKPHRMMIDTGATTSAFSTTTARSLGMEVDEGGLPVIIETANGKANAYRARIEKLKVGPNVRGDFPVLVSDNLGDTSLLGMDFLTGLKSWKMDGKNLILN